MKSFYCSCGNRVFFDNDACMACGRLLGFDFAALTMRTLKADGNEWRSADGGRHRYCANQIQYGNCNGLVAADSTATLCPSCGLNEVIPALDRPDNLKLWTRIERAKRRLLYSLRKLNLPLAFGDGSHSLRFRILEDSSRNPAVQESFVATGHWNGAITINIAEADDAVRHAIREQMAERYRTVLGHLRHEVGHFYYAMLVVSEAKRAECRTVFGDERADYEQALRDYYDNGPPVDWPKHFVSAYASAHPIEDFAETFAHFLHIDDALETAFAAGLSPVETIDRDGRSDWIDNWVRLAITLNEILRSLGADDPYPFVLTRRVREKLDFIDRLVCRPASLPGA